MKSFFTKYRFYILILAVAAVFIIVLFAHSAVLTSALDIRVAGTYSTEFPSSENGVIYGVVDPRYLTFDRDGGYVCFDASGQRHHQGTYTVEGRVLSLSSSEGEFSAVYVDDAVYLFSSEGGVTVYTRLSTDTTYIGPPQS